MRPARRQRNYYFSPVISLALNFAGGGVGALEKDTYCIRKSASKPSSTCASCESRLPRVLVSSIPSTSIQCLAVFRSTPVSPVTGCGIIPKEAAALDASDIIRLRKLVGSSSGSRPSCGDPPSAGRVAAGLDDRSGRADVSAGGAVEFAGGGCGGAGSISEDLE